MASGSYLLLFSPLLYWRVHHPVKKMWDVVLPTGGSLILTGILAFWPRMTSPYAPGGYLAGLQNIYAVLGGFFVAALTLIATTDTKILSQPMAGSPRVTFGNEVAAIGRRRFLCLLFGYLAFSCFGLYGVGFVVSLIAPGARVILTGEFKKLASVLFLLFYNFWLSHMFISTLVGLYYFTDRLQRVDPVVERD